MIEPTDEMMQAYEVAAADEFAWLKVNASRQGLAAVLAIVERGCDVTPKLPPEEHRIVGDGPIWSEFANEYVAECVCGAVYGGRKGDVEHRLLDHIEERAS